MATSTETIVEAIRAYRFTVCSEDELQRALAEALTREKLIVTREHRVFGGRIDLHVEHVDTVGIEVKVNGTPAEVGRQIRRYASGGDLDALIVVTTRRSHLDLEDTDFDVPVHIELLETL